MDTNYGMEIVRATEIAALTAARQQGLGDNIAILNIARSAMIKALTGMSIDAMVVNDRFQGHDSIIQMPKQFGSGEPQVDIMAIALEGYRSAADGKDNVTSYAVIANKNSIQPVPNLPMFKLVTGPKVSNAIDINQPPIVNVKRAARILRKYTENVTVCILNQARHHKLIEEVRSCGARIRLIDEGEISGCLAAISGEKVDIYMGYGHAPEGTIIAAAISCLGGYFEGKILYENDYDKALATNHGITDYDKIFQVEDLIRSKEVAIAATGITDGEFLDGVRFTPNGAITNSFVARGKSHTYRKLETRHVFDYTPVF